MGKLLKKGLSLLIYIKCIILYGFSLICSLFLRQNPSYKNLWLIAERGADARDNGYHFFKFLRENHKEVNCAYVISKDAPDYGKISALGRTVEPDTFSHFIAFACAKYKISTHIMGFAPESYYFAILDRYLRLVRGKKIFLQHGIIKDNIAELHYPKVNLDIFISSTIPEYEDLVKNYNFPDGVIRRIGLCRYDAFVGA